MTRASPRVSESECFHKIVYSDMKQYLLPFYLQNIPWPTRTIVLEFISIVCEQISILPIGAKAARYGLPISGILSQSAIDLPKSISTQRVRLLSSTSNQDIRNMVRRILSAIGDLDANEIRTGVDPLSELLPLGGWHPVNINFKIIHYQKDSTRGEFIAKKCAIPSCVICGRIAPKKEEGK
jgi:hypothetical protein